MIVQLRRHIGFIVHAAFESAASRSFISTTNICHRRSDNIDRTLMPELNERDLEEQFVHGSGPGGQNVNKASNCVVLRHLPTGIVLKCHESRLLHINRQLAREWMQYRLDEAVNGEASVAAQQRRLDERKSRERMRRHKLRQELKRAFKEREHLD